MWRTGRNFADGQNLFAEKSQKSQTWKGIRIFEKVGKGRRNFAEPGYRRRNFSERRLPFVRGTHPDRESRAIGTLDVGDGITRERETGSQQRPDFLDALLERRPFRGSPRRRHPPAGLR